MDKISRKHYNKQKNQQFNEQAFYIVRKLSEKYGFDAFISTCMNDSYWYVTKDGLVETCTPCIFVRPRCYMSQLPIENADPSTAERDEAYFVNRKKGPLADFYDKFGIKLRAEIQYRNFSKLGKRRFDVLFFNGNKLVFAIVYNEKASDSLDMSGVYFECRVDRRRHHVYHVGCNGFIKSYFDSEGVYRVKACYPSNFDPRRIIDKTEAIPFKSVQGMKHHYMRYLLWKRT